MTDKLTLGLSDNDALNEHFSRKEAGDECKLTLDGKFELTATIDEVTPGEMVVLSLKTEEVEDESEEVKEPESPVASVMMKEDSNQS